MAQLRQRRSELDRLGVQVLVLTFQDVEAVRSYLHDSGLEWPILIDEKLEVYKAYGMHRGSIWNIWGPASWWIYAKLLLRGRRLRPPAGDVHQLGGDVLIDPQGAMRLHHIGRGPSDRPTIDSLLNLVRQPAAESPG